MKGHKAHSHGANTMDFYAYQSGLRQWDSSYKVLSSLLILLLCVILDDIWVSFTVVLTIGMVNVIGNRVPFLEYLKLLKIPVAFLLLGSVAIAFGISRKALGDYRVFFGGFYLYLYRQDIFQAGELFFKAMGAVSAMYMMALSTPFGELAGVLRKAHVPRLVVELMHMIYRFIFVLMDIHGKMKRAAASRLGYADFRTSCNTFGKTGGNLLLLSLKKADTYYDAMVSRGYDGELRFWEEEKKLTLIQGAGMAAYLLALVLIWYTGTGGN